MYPGFYTFSGITIALNCDWATTACLTTLKICGPCLVDIGHKILIWDVRTYKSGIPNVKMETQFERQRQGVKIPEIFGEVKRRREGEKRALVSMCAPYDCRRSEGKKSSHFKFKSETRGYFHFDYSLKDKGVPKFGKTLLTHTLDN